MISGRPHALEALLRVRATLLERREGELARAVGGLREAEVTLAGADDRLRAGRERFDQARCAPPREGPARELHREQSWQARLAAELAVLEESRQAARASLAAREHEVDAARRALASAHAELETVERAWQAWDQARRAEEQRRAEEELAELAESRPRGRSGL